MCGIAGVYAPDNYDSNALTRMNDCLIHRGPDDAGIYEDRPIGMAHRRLSIVDPESGHQPISNEDGSVVVVFNGEIYNHHSLRESLSNHHFETETDTEVIVHAYEEWGDSFVERLDGMFAFALWDSDAERLLLARDRMGIKPLLLARDGARLAFASELPALLKSGLEHGGLDQNALSQYFVLGFIPSPKTAFQNIEKIRPGTLVAIQDGDVQCQQFYTPAVDQRDPGIETAASELRERVERAVERRLMSDVPLGAFLSGGLDSSIIVGTMAELSDEPVQTFTVGFEEALFDESWAAREVANYHGTNHTEFTVTPEDLRELIPSVISRLGEPFADPSLLPTYVVARETSENVKVALSGDGADELFAGYEKYRGEYFARHYRTIPKPVRSKLIEPAISHLPAHRESRAGEIVRKTQKFLRGGEPNLVDRHLNWLRIADEEAVSNEYVSPARDALAEEHTRVTTWYDADEFSRMLAVDTRFVLPNQMLQKVDLAGMFNSLEVRVPFLDTSIVEYALSLPTSYKITPTERKRILRHAFNDVLPRSVLKRGKQGFDMPIGEWLKGPLADEFRTAIRNTDITLLETDEVLSVFEAHCHGHTTHSKFLWSVYVFTLWKQQMIEQDILQT